jgi:prepilin-type processing-associated H-X9-DG protein
MKKVTISILIILAIGCALFLWRHQALEQLKAERNRLHDQAAEAENNKGSMAAAEPSAQPEALSPEEQSELLRLRGEVTRARRELGAESNRLATLRRAPAVAPRTAAPAPTTELDQRTIVNAGRQAMLDLILYANAHGNQLPATLPQTSGGDSQRAAADVYEFVGTNLNLNTITSAASTIVLREKQPRSNGQGLWLRSYAFADGHVELAQSPSTDFTTWEQDKQKAAQPTPPPQNSP